MSDVLGGLGRTACGLSGVHILCKRQYKNDSLETVDDHVPRMTRRVQGKVQLSSGAGSTSHVTFCI